MQEFQMPSVIECNIETLTDRYGQFIAQPLERGWGITLGNALRRSLLSFIEGSAITAVRIEGILHEFTSIPGVTEDVADILLNLKSVQFIQHSEEPTKNLKIAMKGPAEVKASDIQHDGTVRILNPDVLIATLNEEGSLEMDLILAKGRGYVSADQNAVEDPAFIPLDSIHSPVRKVNYTATETRVGAATDYEKLVMEVWTNGALTPQQAIAQAASLMTDHLSLFAQLTGPEAAVAPEGQKQEAPSELTQLLELPIDELDLSARVVKVLKGSEVETLGDLVRLTDKDVHKIKNFGQKSLQEVYKFLEERNLTLGMEV
jgi:DNA-directed RNA polymerase subunit alpha